MSLPATPVVAKSKRFLLRKLHNHLCLYIVTFGGFQEAISRKVNPICSFASLVTEISFLEADNDTRIFQCLWGIWSVCIKLNDIFTSDIASVLDFNDNANFLISLSTVNSPMDCQRMYKINHGRRVLDFIFIFEGGINHATSNVITITDIDIFLIVCESTSRTTGV